MSNKNRKNAPAAEVAAAAQQETVVSPTPVAVGPAENATVVTPLVESAKWPWTQDKVKQLEKKLANAKLTVIETEAHIEQVKAVLATRKESAAARKLEREIAATEKMLADKRAALAAEQAKSAPAAEATPAVEATPAPEAAQA